MSKIKVDLTVKESNGKRTVILDKMRNISVNRAIEILKIKYYVKGLYSKILKGLNIMAEDMESLLKKK